VRVGESAWPIADKRTTGKPNPSPPRARDGRSVCSPAIIHKHPLMLPKKIPNYVLLIIWTAGTLPYVVITFWLKDIPAAFPKADKLGDLIAGFSSAFSTAFPFWFVVEWFTRRERVRELAQLQRAVIDGLITDYNDFMRSWLPRTFKKTDSPFHQRSFGFCSFRVYELHKFEPERFTDRQTSFCATVLFKTVTMHLKKFDQYKSHFTPRFVEYLDAMERMAVEIGPKFEHDMLMYEGDKGSMSRSLQNEYLYRYYLLLIDLDLVYREAHGQPHIDFGRLDKLPLEPID